MFQSYENVIFLSPDTLTRKNVPIFKCIHSFSSEKDSADSSFWDADAAVEV